MDSAGLYCKQQYEDLMHGLTRREASVAEKALQTRIEHLEALVDLEEPAQPVPPPPHPQQVVTAAPPPEERVRKLAAPPAPTFVHATPVARSVANDAAPPTRYRQQQGRGEKFQRHGAMII